MRIARFGVLERSNAAKRLVGRVAVVVLLSTASVVLLQANAFASGSDGLSSTILANPVLGLVPLPLGTENGPITQSNVGLIEGNNKSASSALDQALANGTVTAYIRSWSHQPSNGDADVITAFQFKNASDETSFVNGFNSQLQSQSSQAENAQFAVAGIPGASGIEVHTAQSGIALTEYIVSFTKGNTAFQEFMATSSGDLTTADAVSVADQQFANAPDIPANGSGTNWHLLPGVPLVGLLLCIVIIVIGRKRKYPEALRGLPPRGGNHWAPPAVAAPSGPWASYSSPVAPVSNEQHPKVSVDQWQ
jgi:hypothetical protein